MSFCASCGRQRDETGRFCSGCGAAYADASGVPGTTDNPAGPDEQAAPQPGPTRTDMTAQAARADAPGDKPDPFASWYQPLPPAAAADGPGDGNERWQPTQTVEAAPTRRAGYPAPLTPGAPAAPPFPPVPPPGGPERGGQKGLFIALAVVIVLAAGGGAYALATKLGQHTTAQPPAQPTVSASGTGSTTGASPAPSPGLSLVAVAPGVTSSAAQAQVETLLSRYFAGINSRDYAEYASTLNPARQAQQPRSVFDSGYATTTDSGMTLTSLTGDGGGGLTATVTFTSHQSAAQSIDKSSCNDWTLNFYLVPQGTGYLIGPAAAGYQPDYSDC
jgi:hypothetical protein